MPTAPMPTTWNKRNGKEMARAAVVSAMRGPVETALWLPGRDLLDIRMAMKHGLIDEETRNIVVEKNKVIADHIERTIKTEPELRDRVNGVFHVGELADLNVRSAVRWHRKLQFANLDLCGFINRREAEFLFGLADDDVLSDDAVLAVTTYGIWRNFPFGEEYINHRQAWEKMAARIFDPLIAEAGVFGYQNHGCYQFILRTLEMVYSCLWRYELKLVNLMVYHDSSPMSVAVFRRVRSSDPQRTYGRRIFASELLGRQAYSAWAPETTQIAHDRVRDLVTNQGR